MDPEWVYFDGSYHSLDTYDELLDTLPGPPPAAAAADDELLQVCTAMPDAQSFEGAAMPSPPSFEGSAAAPGYLEIWQQPLVETPLEWEAPRCTERLCPSEELLSEEAPLVEAPPVGAPLVGAEAPQPDEPSEPGEPDEPDEPSEPDEPDQPDRKPPSRSKFTREQVQELEKVFQSTNYPTLSRRRKLANDMKVSENRVQVWFKNRRAKDKRQKRKNLKKSLAYKQKYFVMCWISPRRPSAFQG